ncbi:suppressor of SWI4 1 homolog [Caerostris darwini]|uniref:Suppressor of SWI4 1 homolog n=1 Tax=Caerostris darwini TaxID=1538125 RepID=A0AAV4S9T2_9ARAC|nr:suppressor of SWI4 1 homolog [Caerostris darwini]
MARRKRGRTAKNARKNQTNAEPEEIVKAPHSFVINRGKLGKNANELLLNFRKIMEPFTAAHLKVKKVNVLKDFVNIAGLFNVTHLVIFTKSKNAMYLRFTKLPHGPTLTFQIKEYSLVSDVISSQKKSVMYEKLFEHHPLLVLNNFKGEGMHFKLMATMFQNMFPSINVNKINLNTIRRCLLLNYNEDKTIELRQYAIKVIPTGMSKAVKKLIQNKVPNLSQYEDIGDFLQKSGNLSESEVEMDTPANTVILPQPISSRGNITSEKSAIRLYEIGPRIKMQLVKIEEGLMSGEILFHEYLSKTPEEIEAIKAKIKAKKHLKEQRQAQQKKNVEKKKAVKESKKNDDAYKNNNDVNEEDEVAEDLEWYRQEVGEEPDESIVPILKKRKASFSREKPRKRVKFSENAKQDSRKIQGEKKKFFNGGKKEKTFGKFQKTREGKFSKHSKFASSKQNRNNFSRKRK